MKIGLARIIGLFHINAVVFLFVFSNLSWATDNITSSTPTKVLRPNINSGASSGVAAPSSSIISKKIVAKPTEKPLWNELNAAQQLVLSPLAPEWNKLEKLRKQKWLEIANKFQTMKPEEQQRMHDRMREWAKLTPEQRRLARENFSRANKIDRAQKTVQWQQYQQLSEEQKKKLAARAVQKKQLANLPSASQSKQKAIAPIKPKTSPILLEQDTNQKIQQPIILPDSQLTEK